QVVTRALRRGATEDRRLDVQETVVVQIVAHGAGDLRAHAHAARHFRAAQIDEAVAQAHVLADLGMLVEHEGRRLGTVQHLEIQAQHLDSPGGHVAILGPGRTGAHAAGNLQHVLAAYLLGTREALLRVRVDHDLGYAVPVAHVQEDHATVVTAPVHPATEHDGLADVVLVETATIMSSHRVSC